MVTVPETDILDSDSEGDDDVVKSCADECGMDRAMDCECDGFEWRALFPQGFQFERGAALPAPNRPTLNAAGRRGRGALFGRRIFLQLHGEGSS